MCASASLQHIRPWALPPMGKPTLEEPTLEEPTGMKDGQPGTNSISITTQLKYR